MEIHFVLPSLETYFQNVKNVAAYLSGQHHFRVDAIQEFISSVST